MATRHALLTMCNLPLHRDTVQAQPCECLSMPYLIIPGQSISPCLTQSKPHPAFSHVICVFQRLSNPIRTTMRSLCVSWYLASYCWIASTLAAENTNNQFSEPDGSLNDFDQTYTVGDTLNIKWRAGWWGSVSQPDNVDLFICWYKSDSFSTLLIGELGVIRTLERVT
jgi:hypothetical protein